LNVFPYWEFSSHISSRQLTRRKLTLMNLTDVVLHLFRLAETPRFACPKLRACIERFAGYLLPISATLNASMFRPEQCVFRFAREQDLICDASLLTAGPCPQRTQDRHC